jgi:DNA-binding CsgD family transcriptional regulator
MELNTFKTKLVDVQRNQDYGVFSNSINFDSLISKYAHFPNEALYIVDCQTAELEFLTKNINQLLGIQDKIDNPLFTLYENIAKLDQHNVLQFGNKGITSAYTERERMLPLNDKFTCVYRSSNNRTIMKNTYILAKDSIGQVRYTLGQLIDVTDLIPYNGFRFQIYGSNAAKLLASVGNLSEYASILSKREIEVLILVSQGLLSKQIASELFIAKGTVDKHRKNIMAKLEVSNSLAAYHKALEMGIMNGF